MNRVHHAGVECGRGVRTVTLIHKLVTCLVCEELLRTGKDRERGFAAKHGDTMSRRKRKDGLPTQRRDGMTKSQKVLLYVAASEDGRHRWEIQKFIVEMNGYDWEEKLQETVSVFNRKTGETKQRLVFRRRWRGYWSENLGKLLPKFCVKDEQTDKWRQNFLVGEGDVVMSVNGRYVYKGGPLIDLQDGALR